MTNTAFRFAVGGFECTSLRDGAFNYPLESFFANVPRHQVEDVLREHGLPADQVVTPYTCLLIETGQHRVLVDAGAGNLDAHAAAMFPSIDHSTTVTGMLPESLVAIGMAPSDIDTVVITHAHPDHIGGMLDEAGALVYARAHYFIPEAEWTFWFSDRATAGIPDAMVSIARRNLAPLKDRITLCSEGAEVVPGINMIPAPGHTPGHVALSVVSNGEQLLHIADVALHPLHLRFPTWSPVFDVLPEDALASKRRIAEQAASANALVFAHHFPPFPNLGHIVRQEQGWRWQPSVPPLAIDG